MQRAIKLCYWEKNKKQYSLDMPYTGPQLVIASADERQGILVIYEVLYISNFAQLVIVASALDPKSCLQLLLSKCVIKEV